MAEKKPSDLNKRLKSYRKFFKGKKLDMAGLTYPKVCPDCGCTLTPTGTHSVSCWNVDASGEVIPATIESWRTGRYKGRCPDPFCNAQLICPDCGAPLPRDAKECPNPKCPKNSRESVREGTTEIVQFPRYCPRCLSQGKGKDGFIRTLNYCPECGLPVMLKCKNKACGHLLQYSDKICPYCQTPTDWDTRWPDKSKPKPQPRVQTPLNGSFVITPYGPMFVFDPVKPLEAAKELAAPAPVAPEIYEPIDEEEEEMPATYTETYQVGKGRPALAILFGILSILCAVGFPFLYAWIGLIAGIVLAAVSVVCALVGIGLGIACKDSHPKAGIAATILGFIGLVACAALCVWMFLGSSGLGYIKDLLGLN